MKRVLALIASHRKLGNCEIAAKEIFRHAARPAELSLIRLSTLRISPCKACYACLMPDRDCMLEDDMKFLINALVSADACILAAPVYCFGPAGILKMIVDRVLEFTRRLPEMAGKPCVVVVAAGVKELRGYTEMSAISAARMLGLTVKDYALMQGAAPGEIFKDESNLEAARRLGRALLDTSYRRRRRKHECPFCWSTTFTLNPGGTLTCAGCANELEAQSKNGSLLIRAMSGDESIITSSNAALEHFQWLVDKKQEFEREREELKKIRERYRDVGAWLKP
ncbi:MAG: NAD(P)H-dependent oxidoreductase [bacterium]